MRLPVLVVGLWAIAMSAGAQCPAAGEAVELISLALYPIIDFSCFAAQPDSI
jgi:hypothetical protein